MGDETTVELTDEVWDKVTEVRDGSDLNQGQIDALDAVLAQRPVSEPVEWKPGDWIRAKDGTLEGTILQVIDNLVFRRHPDGWWEHRIGDIWVRTSGYRDDLFLDEIERLRAKNDVIVTLGNKSQVHVQIDDGKVVHVAWRHNPIATWGPPYTETDNGDADTYTTR